MLIQHIFIAFQPNIERDFYEVDTNLIYQRSVLFFPAWSEYSGDTIRIKKRWIKEALDSLWQLKLIEKSNKPDWWIIPIPILRSRKQTQLALCNRYAKWYKEQTSKKKVIGIRIKHIRAPKRKRGPLNHFLSKA
jgi:hypothetical protein